MDAQSATNSRPHQNTHALIARKRNAARKHQAHAERLTTEADELTAQLRADRSER